MQPKTGVTSGVTFFTPAKVTPLWPRNTKTHDIETPSQKGKKITKLYDGNGLFLWVYEDDGRKYWRLHYRMHGKEKSISLGVYPDISLSEAREKAKLERKKVEEHIDPSIDRKVIKQRAKQAAENSFEAVSREWYSKQLHTWVNSHAKDVMRRLEGYAFPYIGMHPISQEGVQREIQKVRHSH
ncbi:MAG: DUF4102 domain-containing protein [Nitrosomonas sp.]|nr:DUF4102 domain-containing protein [Nitrosomonas sp.]